MRRRVAPAAVWLACTLVVSAVFGRLAAHNLANFRPVSNDEVELIAVAYKLATQGILGSDMYVGFSAGTSTTSRRCRCSMCWMRCPSASSASVSARLA